MTDRRFHVPILLRVSANDPTAARAMALTFCDDAMLELGPACEDYDYAVGAAFEGGRRAIAEDFGLTCLKCGEDLTTGPRGDVDCLVCNPPLGRI